MTLIKEKYESTDDSEPTGEREERDFIKLAADERIRNMILKETRTHEGQYGLSILAFMNDYTDPEGKYIFSIGLKNETGAQSVFNKSMVDTFLTIDPETEYWLIKEAFIDRPIWIAKTPITGASGRVYNKLEWGYETDGKVKPAVPDSSKPNEDEDAPVDSKLLPEVNKCLVKAVTDGLNVFQAAQILKDTFDEPADKAMAVANTYYTKKGLL